MPLGRPAAAERPRPSPALRHHAAPGRQRGRVPIPAEAREQERRPLCAPATAARTTAARPQAQPDVDGGRCRRHSALCGARRSLCEGRVRLRASGPLPPRPRTGGRHGRLAELRHERRGDPRQASEREGADHHQRGELPRLPEHLGRQLRGGFGRRSSLGSSRRARSSTGSGVRMSSWGSRSPGAGCRAQTRTSGGSSARSGPRSSGRRSTTSACRSIRTSSIHRHRCPAGRPATRWWRR